MDLHSKCVKELFKNSPIETRMGVIKDMCLDIPCENFLYNEIVLTKFKQLIIKNIETVGKQSYSNMPNIEKNIEYLQYLYKNDDSLDFEYLCWVNSSKDVLEDIIIYVRPSNWKYMSTEKDNIIIHANNNENNLSILDFQKDIIDKNINPSKIKRRGYFTNTVDWYEI